MDDIVVEKDTMRRIVYFSIVLIMLLLFRNRLRNWISLISNAVDMKVLSKDGNLLRN